MNIPLICKGCGNRDDMHVAEPPCSADCGRPMDLDLRMPDEQRALAVDRLASALFGRANLQLTPDKARETFVWLPQAARRQWIVEADELVTAMLAPK